MIGITVTLPGFSGNEEIKKDALLLDKMLEVLGEGETSCLFLRFRNLLMTTYKNVKRVVKRKMLMTFKSAYRAIGLDFIFQKALWMLEVDYFLCCKNYQRQISMSFPTFSMCPTTSSSLFPLINF